MAQRVLNGFTALKVFSATKMEERHRLGEAVTEWIRAKRPQIVDTVVTQSSDDAFHCLAITVFYNGGQ